MSCGPQMVRAPRGATPTSPGYLPGCVLSDMDGSAAGGCRHYAELAEAVRRCDALTVALRGRGRATDAAWQKNGCTCGGITKCALCLSCLSVVSRVSLSHRLLQGHGRLCETIPAGGVPAGGIRHRPELAARRHVVQHGRGRVRAVRRGGAGAVPRRRRAPPGPRRWLCLCHACLFAFHWLFRSHLAQSSLCCIDQAY